jgi:hypothetical protein
LEAWLKNLLNNFNSHQISIGIAFVSNALSILIMTFLTIVYLQHKKTDKLTLKQFTRKVMVGIAATVPESLLKKSNPYSSLTKLHTLFSLFPSEYDQY